MRLHSYLSRKCTILPSKLNGIGVFAQKSIDKGELVGIWGGVIYSSSEVKEIGVKYPNFITHPFGVYEKYYMGPLRPQDELDDAERFNHSCEPNIGVKGQIILIARRRIKAGEEICIDYETMETNKALLNFKCLCGSKKCRKIIKGSAWKNSDFQKRNKGFFSWYIEERIKSLKNEKR